MINLQNAETKQVSSIKALAWLNTIAKDNSRNKSEGENVCERLDQGDCDRRLVIVNAICQSHVDGPLSVFELLVDNSMLTYIQQCREAEAQSKKQ